MTVVVSGQPERLKANVHQTLEHLVHEALQKSGNQGQAPSEWELRTEERAAARPGVDGGGRDRGRHDALPQPEGRSRRLGDTVIVVDPEVTRLKFERELELWSENEDAYRRRGWVRLGRGEW